MARRRQKARRRRWRLTWAADSKALRRGDRGLPGRFVSPQTAAARVKCDRRHPRSLYRVGPGHYEVNCGDTVIADVRRER